MSAPATPAVPFEQLKRSMRSTWMAGDFGIVAQTIAGAAEAFAERIRPRAGEQALDVACGTGNVALPLARLGAEVTGVDIAPNLLVQARERAAREGLRITFDEGDAELLPYPDASFDLVATMFGAMFAPRPQLVAEQLARVLKPGGRLAMANWTPESFSGRMFQVSAGHGSAPSPAAPNLPPPVLWGDPATVRERLEPFFTHIQTTIIPIDFDLPFSPAGTVDFFRRYFGPTHIAFSRLDEAGQATFTQALEQLWSSANIAEDPHTHTLVRNEYLEVMAIRR